MYTEDEFQWLQQRFVRSGGRSFSGYVRKITLKEPVEQRVRNASFDDFIGEIVRLRKEMTAIRSASSSPEFHGQLIDLHHEIQQTIDKIAVLCMPV